VCSELPEGLIQAILANVFRCAMQKNVALHKMNCYMKLSAMKPHERQGWRTILLPDGEHDEEASK
jgi:hypothetical protein